MCSGNEVEVEYSGNEVKYFGNEVKYSGNEVKYFGNEVRYSGNEVVLPLSLWFSASEVHLHRVVMIMWGSQEGARGGPGGGGGGDGT